MKRIIIIVLTVFLLGFSADNVISVTGYLEYTPNSKWEAVIHTKSKIIPIYPYAFKEGDLSIYDGKKVEIKGVAEDLPKEPLSQLSGYCIKSIESIKIIEE